MKIRFNRKPGMPLFHGPLGTWKDGEVKEADENTAERLLHMYRSPFTLVEDSEKAMEAPANKMIPGAPQNKQDAVKIDRDDHVKLDIKDGLTLQNARAVAEAEAQRKRRRGR